MISTLDEAFEQYMQLEGRRRRMSDQRIFPDDGYSHIDWLVTREGDDVIFDANVRTESGDGPRGGEFTLTVKADELVAFLRGDS